MTYDIAQLKALHGYCSDHVAALDQSLQAGCFYCENTFSPSEIKEHIDAGVTALCPRCGIDAVLPSASVNLTPTLLAAMNDYWFHGERARRKL